MARERWTSSAAFVSLTLGSAIGLGNFWFPGYCLKYGGITFIVPYMIAFFVIGLPIMCLEIGLGQSCQAGHSVAMTHLHRRAGGVGMASVFGAYILLGPYSTIMGWASRIFVLSASTTTNDWLKISNSTLTPTEFERDYNFTLRHTRFERSILNRNITSTALYCETHECGDNYTAHSKAEFVLLNFVANFFVWTVVFFCLVFGIRILGRIAFATTAIPFLILILLLLRGLTLPGVDYGLAMSFNMNTLVERPEIWSDAASQVIFSLGVSVGAVTAFASYNDESTNVAETSLFVAVTNTIFSILCFFFIISTLGYLAAMKTDPLFECAGKPHASTLSKDESFSACVGNHVNAMLGYIGHDTYFTNYPFLNVDNGAFNKTLYIEWFKNADTDKNDVVDRIEASGYTTRGLELLFICLPLAFDTLHNHRFWNQSLFGLLVLLGLNTLFATTGACVTMIQDTRMCFRTSRLAVVSLVCLSGFALSAAFCLNVGDHLVDAFGSYFRIMILFLAFATAFTVGWMHRFEASCHTCGRAAVILLMCTVFVPTLIVCFAWCHLAPESTECSPVIIACTTYVPMLIVGAIVTFLVQRVTGNLALTPQERIWELLVGNVECLRDKINYCAGADLDKVKWYQAVPFVWSVITKFVIPPALLLLLRHSVFAKDSNGRTAIGHYQNLPLQYQLVGGSLPVLALLFSIAGAIFPETFSRFHVRADTAIPRQVQNRSRARVLVEKAFVCKAS